MPETDYRAEALAIVQSREFSRENYQRLEEICSLSDDPQVCQYLEAFIAASPADANFT